MTIHNIPIFIWMFAVLTVVQVVQGEARHRPIINHVQHECAPYCVGAPH